MNSRTFKRFNKSFNAIKEIVYRKQFWMRRKKKKIAIDFSKEAKKFRKILFQSSLDGDSLDFSWHL